ncbi:unnamed protein product [Paramecium primaurelia]|uniref:CHAT domain-containing protein n=1 Tax=Paramecium primaurelia TaxID=5886 RepID=A0A8S1L8E2_PARPR|nr:unnamed protein product [Paramecium primaurelia]
MKEPILITLIVQADKENDFIVQFPLKKVNSMCQIERERLLRFLIKQHKIQAQDKTKVIFEFYDFQNEAFIQEKQVTIKNNTFQFSEKFLGSPEQLVLIVAIFYNFSYSKLIEIDQAIEMFEIDKRQFQEQNKQQQNQIQEYAQQFQEMKNTLDDIQNQLSTQKSQKQIEKADIVILYSNPIIRVNNGIKESLFVDYQSEIDKIVEAIAQSNKPIRYQILNATLNNLVLAINLHPIIIHVISHGDYDEKSACLYLEFQDDGISTKLKTDEIQNMIQNHKAMTRIKLICISSIVAKNIADYIPKAIPTVVFQKFYNQLDLEGPIFWGKFYEKILADFTIQSAYDQAKKDLKLKFWKNDSKFICCCFHKHFEKCPYDPASIGFEVSHSQHLSCVQQKWLHILIPCLPHTTVDEEQCEISCLGRLIHKCTKQCDNYAYQIDTILQKLQITQIDEDTLYANLQSIENKPYGCCCDQLNAILETIENSNQNFAKQQHTYDQKIQLHLFDENANNLNFSEKIENNQEQHIDINFIKVDKQIILVHSYNLQNTDLQEQSLKAISSYFQVYLKQMSIKKQIQKVQINLKDCNINNWIEYVANKLNFQYSNNQDFFIKLKDYFITLKNQVQYLYIFLIENIINIYASDQFKMFYEQIQNVIESHFILVFTVDNVQKDHLKSLTADKLIQLIDLNQLYSLIEIENAQK